VAGIPAAIKKYRFDEQTIERLLKTEWWNIDPESFNFLDTTNIEKFLDDFEDLKIKNLLKNYQVPKIALHEIFMLENNP
jgi:hypothetical protein